MTPTREGLAWERLGEEREKGQAGPGNTSPRGLIGDGKFAEIDDWSWRRNKVQCLLLRAVSFSVSPELHAPSVSGARGASSRGSLRQGGCCPSLQRSIEHVQDYKPNRTKCFSFFGHWYICVKYAGDTCQRIPWEEEPVCNRVSYFAHEPPNLHPDESMPDQDARSNMHANSPCECNFYSTAVA